MNMRVEKNLKNKDQKVIHQPIQLKGDNPSGFIDARPEAVAQRTLQTMANNNSQAMQLKSPLSMVSKFHAQSLKVIQRGGSKWTEHSNRTLIEKRWENEGHACFYTKDNESFYSEAWVNGVYAGAVQIEPKGAYLAMHTRSEQGMDGGLGIIMMSEAVKLVAQYHNSYEFVQMTPAPGAASKKVIEILSAQIGTPAIHQQAIELRKIRSAWQKSHPDDNSGESKEARDDRLQTWNPLFLPEHLLHLNSLVESDETEGVQITGPAGGLIGFDEGATADPGSHAEASTREGASGYGIYVPMAKFLIIAQGF